MKKIIVFFKNEISQDEIPKFRGAVLSLLENAKDFYHNHTQDNKYIYRYPLIQYKRIDRNAAIVGLEDAIASIGDIFNNSFKTIYIGNREQKLEVETIASEEVLVELLDVMVYYKINKWLPLNEKNYSTYINTESFVERIKMLEKIMVGNILSFCKGVTINIENKIECHITDIIQEKKIKHKGVYLLSVDAHFKANISLPDYIGLGKGSSHGFGVIKSDKYVN